MGRHAIELTPELQDAICRTLKMGVDRDTACRREGIGRTTFYSWLQKGAHEDSPEPFRSFVLAVERAEAEIETEVTQGIIRAARDNWQAGFAWLKWRKWAGREAIEISGPGGQPLGVITTQTAEDIRRTILFGESADTPAGALPPEPKKLTSEGDE